MSISNFINSWLRDIVILFIFISIVDLIMAKGNMKKYIDFVIGLLIIFTIINPFLNLSKLNFNLGQEVMKYDQTDSFNKEILSIDQDERIEEIYNSKISKEINRLLEDNSIYSVYKTKIYMEKGEDYGNINNLEVILVEKERKDKAKGEIHIKKIETIKIEESKEIKEESNKYEEIKDLISTSLSINREYISISMKDKGD